MPDLGGFSGRDRGRPSRPGYVNEAPGPRPAKAPPDRDRCPAGWDASLWHLTLRFEQYAAADGITLRAGRPVIYAELSDLVGRWHLRDKSFYQEVFACSRRIVAADRADHCWYHWPPQEPERQSAGELTWVEVVEIIMAEHWSRLQDGYALDAFRQNAHLYGRKMTDHWKSLRIKRAVASRPADGPHPVVRRRTPGDTIPVTSKEG